MATWCQNTLEESFTAYTSIFHCHDSLEDLELNLEEHVTQDVDKDVFLQINQSQIKLSVTENNSEVLATIFQGSRVKPM